MKLLPVLLAFIVSTLFLSSCCNSCKKEKQYVNEKVTEEVDTGAKGGITRVEKTIRKEVACGECGSSYCPKPDCCGVISDEVLSRATAQGPTGEPHIGQIATMKVLAE